MQTVPKQKLKSQPQPVSFMPAQALGPQPCPASNCPQTPAETGWRDVGAKSSSRVINKFHRTVQSLSSWNSDTLSCAAHEALTRVHNGFAGMHFMFPPPVVPIAESSLPWGFVFITQDVCLWGSGAQLTLLFALSHPERRAQQFPGAGCMVWGEGKQPQPLPRLLS